jgi:hypothetical protein
MFSTMTDTTSLQEKREQIKRQLATGEYTPLVDAVVYDAGRLVQKLTRNARPMSFSFSTLVVVLAILTIGLLVSIPLGELNPTLILRSMTGSVLLYVSLIVLKTHHGIFTSHLREHIVDAIESGDDLADLQHWLSLTADRRAATLFTVAFGVLSTILGVFFFFTLSGSFVGFGPSFSTMLTLFLYGAGFYNVILFFNLPSRLGRYRFKLYATDPSSSELVHHLSSMFMTFLYLFALLAALATFLMAALGLLVSSFMIPVLAWWVFIAALFAVIQYSLSKIITTAKYKTFSEVQAKIERLQADANLAEKETREALNWLMEYHDRIKSTRSTALDLRALLSFVNSLLLPLVAFLLANLGTIVALFR